MSTSLVKWRLTSQNNTSTNVKRSLCNIRILQLQHLEYQWRLVTFSLPTTPTKPCCQVTHGIYFTTNNSHFVAAFSHTWLLCHCRKLPLYSCVQLHIASWQTSPTWRFDYSNKSSWDEQLAKSALLASKKTLNWKNSPFSSCLCNPFGYDQFGHCSKKLIRTSSEKI